MDTKYIICDRFGKGKCLLCDIDLTSANHTSSHMHGKKHQKLCAEKEAPKQSPRTKETWCEICQKPFTGFQSADQHYQSEKHKKKENELHLIKQFKSVDNLDSASSSESQVLENRKSDILEREGLIESRSKQILHSCKNQRKDKNGSEELQDQGQDKTMNTEIIVGPSDRKKQLLDGEKCAGGPTPSVDLQKTGFVEPEHCKNASDISSEVSDQTKHANLISPKTAQKLEMSTEFCGLCHVKFSGRESAFAHYDGKKHKRNVELDNFNFEKLYSRDKISLGDDMKEKDNKREKPACDIITSIDAAALDDTDKNEEKSALKTSPSKLMLGSMLVPTPSERQEVTSHRNDMVSRDTLIESEISQNKNGMEPNRNIPLEAIGQEKMGTAGTSAGPSNLIVQSTNDSNSISIYSGSPDCNKFMSALTKTGPNYLKSECKESSAVIVETKSNLEMSALFCGLCRVSFTGPESATEHYNGKKHKKNEKCYNLDQSCKANNNTFSFLKNSVELNERLPTSNTETASLNSTDKGEKERHDDLENLLDVSDDLKPCVERFYQVLNFEMKGTNCKTPCTEKPSNTANAECSTEISVDTAKPESCTKIRSSTSQKESTAESDTAKKVNDAEIGSKTISKKAEINTETETDLSGDTAKTESSTEISIDTAQISCSAERLMIAAKAASSEHDKSDKPKAKSSAEVRNPTAQKESSACTERSSDKARAENNFDTPKAERVKIVQMCGEEGRFKDVNPSPLSKDSLSRTIAKQCPVCFVPFSSPANGKQHYEGKAHKKKIDFLKISDPENPILKLSLLHLMDTDTEENEQIGFPTELLDLGNIDVVPANVSLKDHISSPKSK